MADPSAPDSAAPATTPGASPSTPAAAPPVAPPPVAETTPSAPKIKAKTRTQRACDEKVEKGKLCCGHLKRWYDYPKEIEALIGPKAEIYRCEFCKTLYKPDKGNSPHSYTIRY
ncbi:MAG: hypothetical protein WA755_05265 [Candidatus Acidiferrales bacterium]